jgi:hypothetical protein
MAGFRTHITVSTSLGVAYGAAGYFYAGLPDGVCLLATGLCSVSGMLPDLDSDSGVPLRESLAFAAAVVPMLMIPRWRTLGFTPEHMVLVGSLFYLAIRFGVGKLLKKYTVHRGMFHSIPAALIATELAFLLYSRKDINLRYYVAAAVAAGFMSHLILDEIWSVGVKHGQIALKKSFGTAVKFWSDSRWANFSCYAKLAILSFFVFHDPVWMYDSTPPGENLRLIAQRWFGRGSSDEDMPPLKEVPRDPVERRALEVAPQQPYYGQSDPRYQQPQTYYQPQQDPRFAAPVYVQPRTIQPRYVPSPRYGDPQPRYRTPREDERWIYQR